MEPLRPPPTAASTPQIDAQRLIPAREVATILDVSVRTVWRLLCEGKIIAPVRVGRSVRWRRAELILWIEQGCPLPSPARRPK